MTLEDFLTFFDKQPYVGVMIYTDKIIYVNNKIEQLLGFSKEEILKMAPYEIFPEGEIRKKIKTVVQKRLKGEEFPATYEPMEIINKYNKRVLIKFFYTDNKNR